MDLFSTKIAYASSANLNKFITNVDNTIINPLILFLFALAVVYFLYGVLDFLMNQENEEKKTAGKKHILWGIVGITIMLGVWTIMGMLLNTFGITYVHPESGTVDQLPSSN
jgi:succinate dehydrogenase/fumarate reductase cytochrome b subunit